LAGDCSVISTFRRRSNLERIYLLVNFNNNGQVLLRDKQTIMKTTSIEIKDTETVLSGLLENLKGANISGKVYLSGLENKELPNTAAGYTNAFGVNEQQLPQILQQLGVRSITLDEAYNLDVFSGLKVEIPNAGTEQHKWRYFRTLTVLQALRGIFANCHSIAFDDWSNVAGSSDILDGLLNDVIKPTGKKDIEYIFYLGTPLERHSFLIEEALDIITDFSFHGKVTFALDENEAAELWAVLNNDVVGTAAKSLNDLTTRYLSIFNRMKIARLLIYSVDTVILFSKQGQFCMARKTVAHDTEIGPDARQNFITGFNTGLLLNLDASYCIALGLITFGTYDKTGKRPMRGDFLGYINSWLGDLQAV
jgi:hypothetical protein